MKTVLHPRTITLFPPIVLLAGLAAAQGSEAPQRSPLGEKPNRTVLVPEHEAGILEVKFVHGSGVRLVQERFQGSADGLDAVDAYLDSVDAVRHRLFAQPDGWLEAWRLSGELASGRALHDLTLFYRITLEGPTALVAEVCDALNAFDVVELAYPIGRVEDATAAVMVAPAGSGTPDFEALQGYRRAAPLGIDADYGQTFSGSHGQGTTIAEVETGWTDDHEDIAHAAEGNYIGLAPLHYPWNHGTAVLGELVGDDNGFGVRGIVYEADVLLSTHQGSGANIPTAVANAAAAVGPGDVVVIEAQCFGTPPSPFPCEFVASTFATIETATANGIHVFAAAGNGNVNLDGAAFGGAFDRDIRDSGAFIIGASDGSSLNKASFSNYGSRLDAHGWGSTVTTAGYGDLFGAGSPVELREYTATFSGTSSATPIVTGAGIMLNGIYRGAYGTNLDPFALRDLVTLTGTPQGTGGQIGPRPDVRAAIAQLGIPRIAVAGNLVPGGSYTVTHTGDAGDLYVICFSPEFLLSPIQIPPYGSLYLGSPFFRIQTGVLSASGEASYSASIPNDGTLAGTTIGYYESWQRFQSGPGGGTFTNYVPIEVQ
ncbi:MAG: hypothetical protein E2O39_08625 [Planctomycetota bacterium]|nr:MAG: hypothetical protein E2O39_08625 [Planctomycetota bacterium]